MNRLVSLIAAVAVMVPAASYSQSVPLQGGTWTGGHVPMYSSQGSVGSQPVIVDGGKAGGGALNTNIGELGLTARGSGNPPYDAKGTGPNGEIFCLYDGPITSAAGYHYLCMSPSVSGAGLLSYGTGGTATPQGFNLTVNGNSGLSISPTGVLSLPLSALFDATFGSAQGSVLYRGASAWTALAPGAAGTYLEARGAAANPRWSTPTISQGVVRVLTSGASTTVLSTDFMVVVNKTVPSATRVYLPSSPDPNFLVVVKDGGGNASSNNITIDGNGNQIDGASTIVISSNYSALNFAWDGTSWRVW